MCTVTSLPWPTKDPVNAYFDAMDAAIMQQLRRKPDTTAQNATQKEPPK